MAAGESQITELHLSDDFLEDVRRSRPCAGGVAPPAPAPRIVSPAAPATQATDAFAPPAGMASERDPAMSAAPSCGPPADAAAARTLGEAEIEMIRQALAAAGGNISVASKRLGISRNTIYRKLRWGKSD
jgi:DNA-binding NtrC family response regulator